MLAVADSGRGSSWRACAAVLRLGRAEGLVGDLVYVSGVEEGELVDEGCLLGGESSS